MGDKPGGFVDSLNKGTDFHSWQSFDSLTRQQQRPGDRVQPGADRTARPGSIELSYNDPNFDQKLWQSGATSLKINDFPRQGVAISSWVDDKGFFIWYQGGNDNKKPHYLPGSLKQIEVNGVVQNVDEMKIQASLSAAQEADRSRTGFTSFNERTDPLTFAKRMGGLGWDQLQMQEKALAQAAKDSPNNPYFRLYLADIKVAEAFKPIIDQVSGGGSRIQLDTPFTRQKLEEARQEALQAEKIAQQVGGARYPNLQLMPQLNPFFLNPAHYNPDLYWSGALYQGYRREAQIRMLQHYIQQFSNVELPPILPGK
jgi:hypothetical protein